MKRALNITQSQRETEMQYKSITRETLLSYLDDYLKRGTETVFVQRRGLRSIRWSYERLVLVARQTARELQVRGVVHEDRVLLCGENSPEWAAAFWGCLMLGAVVVPLDKGSTRAFAVSVQQKTNAKFAFISNGADDVSRLEVPQLTLDQLSETVNSHSTDSLNVSNITSNSLAQIIFTSGTTSTPKGVLLTHGNLLANLLPIEWETTKYLKWERFVHPVRFLSLVPMSHVFGQIMGLFVPQLIGAEVHFHNSLNPAEIVNRVRKDRLSVVVLVPRLLESLRQWLERNEDASNLTRRVQLAANLNLLRKWWRFRRIHRRFGLKFWAFLSGGATLEEDTENFWRGLGFAVLQGYGLTETASLISVTHPFKDTHRSIGKLMPGYEVKLDDAGEIIVRGPSVSPGYWNGNGGQSRKVNEWFHTGDVGEIDDSGHLQFKGRTKEVIVTAAGLNVYPEDLEHEFNQQPEVKSSCVIKWSGPQGEEPLVVLILKDSSTNVTQIVERVNKNLSEYQRVRRWHVWDGPGFPLTPTHKVLKREVAARVQTESTTAQPNSSSPNFILAEAARISGSPVSADNNASVNLTTDLKLDSLGRVELLSALENEYQIAIDEAAFTEATTVADVERIVRGEAGETAIAYPYPEWSRILPARWLRIVLYYTIILPITLLMSRMSVSGTENLKNINGPVLFIANHVTVADHALILAALPAHLRHRVATAMEGERLRDWLHAPHGTSFYMRLRGLAQYFLVTTFFHVFPLPKKSGFRRSFARAAELVESGQSVLVFPEGRRAPRGQMQMNKFKPGIGVLTTELDLPVVPIKLRGLYELKRRKQYFAPKDMVSVTFGSPIRFDSSTSPTEITEELQRQVELL